MSMVVASGAWLPLRRLGFAVSFFGKKLLDRN
jgi:hypothetical protein